MELKLELSSARNWISGLKGIHSCVENQQSCEKGKKPWTSFEALSLEKGTKKPRESFSRGKSSRCGDSSKGKVVFWGSEFEDLNERLKVLEEETEMMKEAFFWCLEERKAMMNEIYEQFHLLRGCLKPRNLLIEESSITNPFEDWRVRKRSPEILSPDHDPPFITRELRANYLAFQEPASYRGYIKFHHD